MPAGLFVAILLAAGESTRMGQMKALLDWEGTSLINYQVSTLLEAGIAEVIIVLGHEAAAIQAKVIPRDRIRFVMNHAYKQGKTTSIKSGLNALDGTSSEGVMFLNVDQPRTTDTIAMLMECHNDSSAQITIPTYKQKGGHPIIFDSNLIPELLCVNEETFGLKHITDAYSKQTQRLEVADPSVLWDLNTPDQYNKVHYK